MLANLYWLFKDDCQTDFEYFNISYHIIKQVLHHLIKSKNPLKCKCKLNFVEIFCKYIKFSSEIMFAQREGVTYQFVSVDVVIDVKYVCPPRLEASLLF